MSLALAMGLLSACGTSSEGAASATARPSAIERPATAPPRTPTTTSGQPSFDPPPLRNGVETALVAPEASSPARTATGAPRVRAPGRWFIHGMVATDDTVSWLELLSQAEGSKDGDKARSRWVRMPSAGGPPRIAASELVAGPGAIFGADDTNLYVWLGAPTAALHSVPLEGGTPRALAPAAYDLTVAAEARTVCFVSREVHTDGLFCMPRGQTNPISIASVEGGTGHVVVLGDHVYWYERGARCVLRARVDRTGARPQRLSCSGALMGPLASDGKLLYVLGGAIADDGDHTFAYTFDPVAGEWTLLRDLPGDGRRITAHAGHVALLTTITGEGDTVTVVDAKGRACVLAQHQRDAGHPALGAGRAFWTAGKKDIGHADVMEQSFTMDASGGPCAAPSRPR